jgi:hypothetical protein
VGLTAAKFLLDSLGTQRPFIKSLVTEGVISSFAGAGKTETMTWKILV